MPPSTEYPAVIRTDFDNQEAWDTICDLIRVPVREGDYTFYAYVKFVEELRYRDQPVAEVLRALPHDYKLSFLFIVDRESIAPDFTVLVVDLLESRGRTFRTIPTQVQGIENKSLDSQYGL